jgi:tetratricopeptide (TPR) repeat protein
MEGITIWKSKGNEFFKMKDFLKAINCYEEALESAKNLERDL